MRTSWRRIEQQHDRAVLGKKLVVLLARQELQSGRASSARISMAIAPATMKKPNVVTRCSLPICLWSVVPRYASAWEPIGARARIGDGLVGGEARLSQEPPHRSPAQRQATDVLVEAAGEPRRNRTASFDLVWRARRRPKAASRRHSDL
jgi:hypothetical protein